MNTRWKAAVLVVASLAVTACGSGADSGDRADGALPAEIKVISINPETGPAAFAGLSANKGYEVAIEEINNTGYLGATKLVLDKRDTAGKAQTAASHTTAAVTDKSYTAIFGSVASSEAVAMAPIVEKARTPTVFTQASSDGVVIGDYTFRLTPLMATYYRAIEPYIKSLNITRLAVVYAAWSPTLKQVAEQAVPAMAETAGFEIVASIATQQTTQDFAAPISQALATNPDGVAILLVASYTTAITQLRQAGWTGPVLGASGASAGNLKPAGPAGAGVTWVTDYSALNQTPESEKFVATYQKKFQGEVPLNYAAEAYDAAWLLARGIKETGSADRPAVQEGMSKVVATGYTGAMGTLTFDGNDVILPGVVVQWDGIKEILVPLR